MNSRILYLIAFICTINIIQAQTPHACYDIEPMPPVYSFVCIGDTMKCTISIKDKQHVFLCNKIKNNNYTIQLSDTVMISLHLRRLWVPLNPLWNTSVTADEIKFCPVGTCKCRVKDNVISFRLKGHAYSGPKIIWRYKEDPLRTFLIGILSCEGGL